MKENFSERLDKIIEMRKSIARNAVEIKNLEGMIEYQLQALTTELTPEDLRPMEEADLKFGTLFFHYDRLSQAYAHGYVSEKLNSFHFEGADGCDYTLHYKFVLKD